MFGLVSKADSMKSDEQCDSGYYELDNQPKGHIK